MDQTNAVQHLRAPRAGEGLAHAEELLVLEAWISVSRCLTCKWKPTWPCNSPTARLSIAASGRTCRGTNSVRISPLESRVLLELRWLTILKCTGGPPKDVKPRYHVSLTVFQNLAPIFPQARCHAPGATQVRSAIISACCCRRTPRFASKLPYDITCSSEPINRSSQLVSDGINCQPVSLINKPRRRCWPQNVWSCLIARCSPSSASSACCCFQEQ